MKCKKGFNCALEKACRITIFLGAVRIGRGESGTLDGTML